MNEPHLILGVGELLWDIFPAAVSRPGAVPVEEFPPAPEASQAAGIEVADAFTPAAVSPEEILPIGLLSNLPMEAVAPPGLPPPSVHHRRTAMLGGAPANFAVMAGHLGNHAAILSRIGRDDLGRTAAARLNALPVDTSYLEVDPAHETGRVTVSFKSDEPAYTIHEPAAWDFLELEDGWVQAAERAHAICFGTLAQRNERSRRTIQALVAQSPIGCIRVFDVNLRAPYYSAEVIQESLELATVVKMNEEEQAMILRLLDPGLDLDLDGDPGQMPDRKSDRQRASAGRLLDEFPALRMVAITRGSRGSLLVSREEWNEHAGIRETVADSIGAGDAFTAAVVHYMLRGAGLATLNEAGNRWGAWVASQSGAMPALPDQVRTTIAAAIEG